MRSILMAEVNGQCARLKTEDVDLHPVMCKAKKQSNKFYQNLHSADILILNQSFLNLAQDHFRILLGLKLESSRILLGLKLEIS